MDPHRLRLSLVAVQLVGLATLLRSIAYDRWITVLASVLLLLGATAAQRGRTWGVPLAFGAAVAFPVAWAIGIAPPWFCLVGLVGSLPFALSSRAFARFDKGATALLALLAVSAGTLGALAWKQFAWSLFEMFPSIQPSIHAQHGLALTVVAASAALATRFGHGSLGHGSLGHGSLGHDSRVRVGVGVAGHMRVAGALEEATEADVAEVEAETDEPRRAQR